MTSSSVCSSSRHALVGAAFVTGVSLTSASALADPLPVSPVPAPPPVAGAARSPQRDSSQPSYPRYVYVPADWTPPPAPGMAWTPQAQRRVWYGWQTMLVYAGSTTVGLATALGGGFSGSAPVMLTGAVVGEQASSSADRASTGRMATRPRALPCLASTWARRSWAAASASPSPAPPAPATAAAADSASSSA